MNSNISSILESILFAAGEAVSKKQLSEILDINENEIAKEIEELEQFYRLNNRGLKIIEIDSCYQLCTVEENYRYIQCIVEPRKKQGLSPAALEVLSIVAYNQPVTRSSIEYIRGVNCDGPVNRLIERGLIEENGRLDAPGRPILYVTTQEFLRSFGLSSLASLPDIEAFEVSIDEALSGDTQEE